MLRLWWRSWCRCEGGVEMTKVVVSAVAWRLCLDGVVKVVSAAAVGGRGDDGLVAAEVMRCGVEDGDEVVWQRGDEDVVVYMVADWWLESRRKW
ncbi:hypothetical protein Tco_0419831, partial [Tanacetum coccineum]